MGVRGVTSDPCPGMGREGPDMDWARTKVLVVIMTCLARWESCLFCDYKRSEARRCREGQWMKSMIRCELG